MSHFWEIVITRINPETREADGYFDGYPGLDFRFALNADQPGEIDLTLRGVVPSKAEEDLPAEVLRLINKGMIESKGIYTLKDDTLTICWGCWTQQAGRSFRPTEFTSIANSNRILLVLKRKPKG